jgi:GNAT superfamily N-acetyltransferase
MGFMTQLNAATEPRNGTWLRDVRVRPFGIGDVERLRRMSAHLSPQSLYTRYWSGAPYIPDYHVRAMTSLDHWDREAVVALLDGEMIGIAEYVRDAARPDRADLAVLVADPWQRRGLGRLLIACLAQLAERRRIGKFDADIILENRRATQAVLGGWPDARSTLKDGAAHFSLPLPIPVPA